MFVFIGVGCRQWVERFAARPPAFGLLYLRKTLGPLTTDAPKPLQAQPIKQECKF
jgi:hypothetical protein